MRKEIRTKKSIDALAPFLPPPCPDVVALPGSQYPDGSPVGGDPAGGGVPMGSAVSAGVGVPMGAGVPIASFKFAHRAHSGASWEYYDDATSAMIADAMARQPAGGSSRLSNPALPFEVRWGTMTTGGNIVQVNLNSGNTRIVKRDEAASAGASPGVGARFSHQGLTAAVLCRRLRHDRNAQLTQPAGGVVGLRHPL